MYIASENNTSDGFITAALRGTGTCHGTAGLGLGISRLYSS